MLKSVLILLIILTADIFISCSNSGSEREKISFETVLEGSHSAINEKRELLIKSDKEYQKLMDDVYKDLDQMPRIPEVDFAKNSIIAVFIGQRSSGGFLVNVDSINESANGIYVEVNETVPGKTCIVSDVMTAPFVIVKIPKTEKKASFKYKQTVKECQ